MGSLNKGGYDSRICRARGEEVAEAVIVDFARVGVDGPIDSVARGGTGEVGLFVVVGTEVGRHGCEVAGLVWVCGVVQ